MSRRFADFRLPRHASSAGEILTTWIAVAIGIMLLALAGYLLGQFFPPSYG